MAPVDKALKKPSCRFAMGSKAWHKNQVALYHQEFPIYQIYAEFLRKILEEIAALYAPDAIVQVRAKTISSFAEKAIRKSSKYDDPIHQITDLCGGRIITSTLEEVDRISEFMRANFIIDEANSLDVKTRLKVSEFGYLSIHYIVQIQGDKVLGVPVPKDIGFRKAEIQVRTFLQHAWAVMSHDRMYKSGLKVPEQWIRDLAEQAALMENADEAFNRIVKNLELYQSNYGVSLTREKLQTEKEILETILENEPLIAKKSKIALNIAKLVKSVGDWETIIKTLKPYASDSGPDRREILVELGHALCQKYKMFPEGAEYRRGQRLIAEVAHAGSRTGSEETAAQADHSIRSKALLILARSYRDIKGQEHYAKELYQEAYLCDPTNPYHFTAYLDYNICFLRDIRFFPLMRPSLMEAVKTCRAHIRAGIELPWAYLTIGRLYLLLGENHESLVAYTKAVEFCITEKACFPKDIFDNELEFLQRINHSGEMPESHQWVRILLLLGKTIAINQGQPLPELLELASRHHPQFLQPVLLVSGGTQAGPEAPMQHIRKNLARALLDFHGTVISGGTTSGIPGMIGSIAKEHLDAHRTGFKLVGYLPRLLPADIYREQQYEIVSTCGEDFSPREALQTWVDLVAGGIRPDNVRFIGINGGLISAFEYRLALAMGARVGILESSGRAAAELQRDSDWWATPNLYWLPLDAMTIRAFIAPGQSQIKFKQLDKLGQIIHRNYQNEVKASTGDPSVLSWEKLSDDFKESNRRQAAYAEEIIRSHGFGVRTNAQDFPCLQFTDAEVEAMAEMEHGRWVVERLGKGWRYGSKKDVIQKMSPYLKPWDEIPESIKKYDRDAVRNFPKLLKEAELEVYRLSE